MNSMSDFAEINNIGDLNDVQMLHSHKKSKTRKVLSAAKRPLKAVGRLASMGRKSAHTNSSYDSILDEDEEMDRDDISAAIDGIVPKVITPVLERRGSFMERVNQYRSGASQDGGSSTPRRGSLTNAIRGGVAVVGNGLTGGPIIGEEQAGGDPRDWVVVRMERHLRQLLLLMLAFVAGTFRLEWRTMVQRVLEWVTVAWATCCVLWVMSRFSSPSARSASGSAGLRSRRLLPSRRANSSGISDPFEAEVDVALKDEFQSDQNGAIIDKTTVETRKRIAEEIAARGKAGPVTADLVSTGRVTNMASSDDELAELLPQAESEVLLKDDSTFRRQPKRRSTKKKVSVEPASDQQEEIKMPHPALNQFYCIDTTANERVITNAKKAYVLDNEWFTGTMMVLIRTPDVDDSSQPKGTEENDFISAYMQDKQRRWEFQYQIKLKKVPHGQKIYFSAELKEPVKMGMIQRAFVGAAMAFIKSTNGSFHYSMAGSKEDPDGRWEKPHMSFPVEMSMDRVVVTKPDDTPPALGGIINEDPEAMRHRKKGGLIDWNTNDTYTMALWTAYVDFLDWKVINLPGIRPFDLSKVIGPQPILLTLYLIPHERAAEKHFRRDITQVVELELSNTTAAKMGEKAKQWLATRTNGQAPLTRSDANEEDEGSEEDEDDDEEIDDEDIQESEDDEGTEAREEEHGELVDETEYESADAATAAELGEGMYLRSGDRIILREDESDEAFKSCFVTNGGGFAVLSEGVSSASTIVIQKARRKNHQSSRARSELIKSGDTVSIQMITKDIKGESEIRYLSIHRGWWLKWVSTAPSKNGFFTIFTHETEFADHDTEDLLAGETQSSYLTFGGSFRLKHKRWKQYSVGAAAEGSATYGGRVLGLFKLQRGSGNLGASFNEVNDVSDDDEMSFDGGESKSSKKRWMKSTQFRAYEACQASNLASTLTTAKVGHGDRVAGDLSSRQKPKIKFSNEDSHLDVPAWVEVLNRTARTRQLAYAVRVIPNASTEEGASGEAKQDEETNPSSASSEPFLRLRTGRDLAETMRIGLSWRSTAPLPQKKDHGQTSVSPQKINSASSPEGMPTRLSVTAQSSKALNSAASMDASLDGFPDEEGSIEYDEESDDDDEAFAGLENVDQPGRSKKKNLHVARKTIGAIGKVARGGAKVAKAGAKGGVKAGVTVAKAGVGVTKAGAAAGKKVAVSSVKASVKVGKGTVSAGKAIIGSTSRSKNPPAREPKSKTVGSAKVWRKERDLYLAVNKTAQRIGPEQSNLFFLAGELAAPEQSYRTVSNILARMSSVPASSKYSEKFNSILSAQIEQPSNQDSWFLTGGAMQVGVVPDPKSESTNGPLLCENLVARCLWESHWREEWCGIYKKNIAFYAPLTQKSCLELPLVDVAAIRVLDIDRKSPLPGYPILAIATAWQCHYVAFKDKEARESFRTQLDELIPKRSDVKIAVASEKELWRARFWQGFQDSVESESAVGRGKWAEVRSGKRSISRSVLNGRRMDFDLDPNFLKEAGGLGQFVEELLETALSFSLSSLERDPERLVTFLDAVSHLRLVPIIDIDRRGVDAFCLFVNLYHCLFQHALLLAVNGPLHRRTVGHFMRASCYEIGGDIFSLAELQSCIIRGNMSRAISPKPPYVDAPKKSDAYRFYALEYTDPRVNFVLNTGDVSCPKEVPILRPETVDEQLSAAAVLFLETQLTVDVIRRCVLLPKICEVYRNDFENDANSCLYFCSRYLEQATVNALKRMLREETTLTIKYRNSADQYHTRLSLRETPPSEMNQSPKVLQRPSISDAQAPSISKVVSQSSSSFDKATE